jgi:hypothetical protein
MVWKAELEVKPAWDRPPGLSLEIGHLQDKGDGSRKKILLDFFIKIL